MEQQLRHGHKAEDHSQRNRFPFTKGLQEMKRRQAPTRKEGKTVWFWNKWCIRRWSSGAAMRNMAGICSCNSPSPSSRRAGSQQKANFHWRHEKARAATPGKLGRHCWAVTSLQDIKIKEWCIKRCGKCDLSFSTVNLWILMTGSHLHLTISVLEHFLGTGDIFLSQ